MFKLQYTNAALGTLIAQGASFFKRIFWKAFPLACVIAVMQFVLSSSHILLFTHLVWKILTLLLVGLLVFYFACALMYQMYGPTQEEQVPSISKSLSVVWPRAIKAIIAFLLCFVAFALVGFVLAFILGFILGFVSAFLHFAPVLRSVMFFSLVAILLVVFFMLAIFISLIVPVAIFENVGVIKVIKRSIYLIRRGFWKSFIVMLIAKLPKIIFYYLVMIAVLLINAGSFADFHTYVLMRGPLMAMGTIQIILLITAPFFIIWSVANVLNLYHTLKKFSESLKRS